MGKTQGKKNKSVDEGEASQPRDKDVTKTLGAPFKVYSSEAKLYEDMVNRKPKKPVVIDYAYWKDLAKEKDDFAMLLVKYVKALKLGKWAMRKESAYPRLMEEFYTSCKISKEGVIHCRIKEKVFEFDEDEIAKILGCYAQAKWPIQSSDYDEEKFWDSLKVKGIGKTKGYPVTAIQDNALYFAYRFVALGLWGKDEPSVVPKKEMYVLHQMKKGEVVNVYPFILGTLRNAIKVKNERPTHFTLGSFITALAKSEKVKWSPGKYDEEVKPRELPCGTRLLRTPLQPWGKEVEIRILRDPNANEDEGYVPNSGPVRIGVGNGIDDGNESEEEEENEDDNGPDLDSNPRPTRRPRLTPPEPELMTTDPAQPASGPLQPDPARPVSALRPARSTYRVVAYSGPSKADFDDMKRGSMENHQVVMESLALIRAENAALKAENAEIKAVLRQLVLKNSGGIPLDDESGPSSSVPHDPPAPHGDDFGPPGSTPPDPPAAT